MFKKNSINYEIIISYWEIYTIYIDSGVGGFRVYIQMYLMKIFHKCICHIEV